MVLVAVVVDESGDGEEEPSLDFERFEKIGSAMSAVSVVQSEAINEESIFERRSIALGFFPVAVELWLS